MRYKTPTFSDTNQPIIINPTTPPTHTTMSHQQPQQHFVNTMPVTHEEFNLLITQQVDTAFNFFKRHVLTVSRPYDEPPFSCGWKPHINIVRPNEHTRHLYTIYEDEDYGGGHFRLCYKTQRHGNTRSHLDEYHRSHGSDVTFFQGNAPHTFFGKLAATSFKSNGSTATDLGLKRWLRAFAKAGFWFVIDRRAPMAFDAYRHLDDLFTGRHMNTTVSITFTEFDQTRHTALGATPLVRNDSLWEPGMPELVYCGSKEALANDLIPRPPWFNEQAVLGNR